MGTTPTYGFPFPESSDPVSQGAANIQALAEAVEAQLALTDAQIAELSRHSQASYTPSSGVYDGQFIATRVGIFVMYYFSFRRNSGFNGDMHSVGITVGTAYRPATGSNGPVVNPWNDPQTMHQPQVGTGGSVNCRNTRAQSTVTYAVAQWTAIAADAAVLFTPPLIEPQIDADIETPDIEIPPDEVPDVPETS